MSTCVGVCVSCLSAKRLILLLKTDRVKMPSRCDYPSYLCDSTILITSAQRPLHIIIMACRWVFHYDFNGTIVRIILCVYYTRLELQDVELESSRNRNIFESTLKVFNEHILRGKKPSRVLL